MTAEARELAGAYRVAQARFGAEAAQVVEGLWRLLDLDDIDGSIDRWASTVSRFAGSQHSESVALARRFLIAHRALAGVSTPLPAIPAPRLDVEALETSLRVVGPYRLRSNLAKGVPMEQAAGQAATETAGVGMRAVLAGGRALITASASADPAVAGMQRRSSGSPCHFCAMLVSRGPVYTSERTASFKAHASCGCTPEPVYDRSAPLTAQAQAERDKWNAAKKRASAEGLPTALVFRQIHEQR